MWAAYTLYNVYSNTNSLLMGAVCVYDVLHNDIQNFPNDEYNDMIY